MREGRMSNQVYGQFLLVDDDQDFCQFLNQIAIRENIVLQIAPSFRQAIQQIKLNKFDGFIIDGYLPDGSGLDLISYIKFEMELEGPVAFISAGYNDLDSFRRLKTEYSVDYVLNKPLYEEKVAELLKRMAGQIPETDIDDFLKDLRDEYNDTIIGKLEKIEMLGNRLMSQPVRENIMALKAEVHKIAGSAGSFGYYEVSRLCKELEITLSNVSDKQQYDFIQKSDIMPLFLHKLKIAFQLPSLMKSEMEDFETEHVELLPQKVDIYFCGQFKNMEEYFKLAAEYSLKLYVEMNIDKMIRDFETPGFSTRLLLVQDDLLNNQPYLMNYLPKLQDKITNKFPRILAVTDSLTQLERYTLLDKGVDFFIPKPKDPRSFFNVLLQMTFFAENQDGTITCWIEEEDLMQRIAAALQSIGMEVTHVDNMDAAYDSLSTLLPTMFIVDARVNPWQLQHLLKMIRTDVRYFSIPVLLIWDFSLCIIPEQNVIIDVDSLLPLNSDMDEIKRKTQQLLSRHTLQKNHIVENVNQSFLTQASFIPEAQKLITRVAKYKEPLGLIYFELAPYSSLREKFGQPVVAEMTKAIQEIAARQFTSDILKCQWGENSFVLLMENADYLKAKFRMARFVEACQQEIHIKEQKDTVVEFLWDVVVYPLDGETLDSLLQEAKYRLYPETRPIEVKEDKEVETPVREKVNSQSTPQRAKAKSVQRVFIVDDDVDLISMLTFAFENRGFEVKSFYNGHDADLAIKSFTPDEHPDLMVLDRELPDMDGIDLFKSLPEYVINRFPIIFLSSKDTKEDILKGLKAGAKEYITKPFSLEIFLEKTLALLAGK